MTWLFLPCSPMTSNYSRVDVLQAQPAPCRESHTVMRVLRRSRDVSIVVKNRARHTVSANLSSCEVGPPGPKYGQDDEM